MNQNDELRLKTDRKLGAGYILKRNYKYLKPEIWKLVASMLFMVVNVVLGLLIPLILQEVVDILSPKENSAVVSPAFSPATYPNQHNSLYIAFLLHKWLQLLLSHPSKMKCIYPICNL